MKIALGFILAISIGIICRLFGVPLPAPPVIVGALLVVAMTSGYLLVGRIAAHRPHEHEHLCGGSTGASMSSQTKQ